MKTPKYNEKGLLGEDRWVIKGLYHITKRLYPQIKTEIESAERIWEEGRHEEAKDLARKVLDVILKDRELDVAAEYAHAFGILEEIIDVKTRNYLRALAQPHNAF